MFYVEHFISNLREAKADVWILAERTFVHIDQNIQSSFTVNSALVHTTLEDTE